MRRNLFDPHYRFDPFGNTDRRFKRPANPWFFLFVILVIVAGFFWASKDDKSEIKYSGVLWDTAEE